MCEPSAEVHRACSTVKRGTTYYLPNKWVTIRHEKIGAGIDRLNDCPEVYLQVVFRYFRDVLQRPCPFEVDMLSYLVTFLRDFGFLPVRYAVQLQIDPALYEQDQTAYQAAYEDRRNLSWLWDLYRDNPFYRDFIRLPPDTHPVHIQLTYYRLVQPWVEHPITINPSEKRAYAQFGDIFRLLQQCFQQYIQWLNMKIQREKDGNQEPNLVGDELIYKTRLSLTVTLLEQFTTQMEVVEGIKNNLATRLNLIDYSLQLLNSSPQDALYLHLRNALSALNQSARFVALTQNANGPPTYLLYLQRIQLYQMQWPWDTNIVGYSPEAAEIFNSAVDHDSLLHGSSLLLQSLNILPSTTNGMLVELLVDHLANLSNQVQRIIRGRDGAIVQQASPFDVRNQLIWYGAVANGWWMYLLSSLAPQSRMALGVPDEFTLDD